MSPDMENLKRKIVTPDGGWQEKTYYEAVVAHSSSNVLHTAIVYSGFLDDNGLPSGYSCVLSKSTYECATPLDNMYYVRPTRVLINGKVSNWLTNKVNDDE